MRLSRRGVLGIGLLGLLGPAGCKKDAPPSPAATASAGAAATGSAPKRIAVIPKGTTHEFWKAAHAGAAKAAKDKGLDIVWKGPLKEDDLKAQIDVVQSFVAQGAAGIVLAPLSDVALRAPVKAAVAAGIPVVVFDSDLQGDAHASFVATDNEKAGRMAGEHMGKVLGGKGKVIMLRYLEGSASTANRERGFLDGAKAAGLTLVSDNQYGGATTESAFATSERLLAAQKVAAGEVQGVFAPNESTTFGMLLALRKAGLAGKVRFVGFDASEKLVGALREGHVDALVVQDPFKMGRVAVETMAALVRGEKVERRVDTGARVVDKAGLDDPAVKALLAPDLSSIGE